MTKELVIIGVGYAGLIAAKKLAKLDFNVTVIAPNDKAFHPPAVPRAFNDESMIKNMVNELSDVFKGLDNVKHIKASVKQLKPETNVLILDNNKSIKYDCLVIASGTSSKSTIYKPTDVDATVKEIKSISQKLKTAKSVAVIGGGATGVETAGDIKYFHKDIAVDLYTGDKRPLIDYPEKKSIQAEKTLKTLGVNVINNTIVTSNTDTSITVDGKLKKYDLVFVAYGVYPNSSFIPKDLLDSKGFLVTEETLVVKDYPNIIGFGDIVALGGNTIVSIRMEQLKVFENSVKKYFLGEQVADVKYAAASPIFLVPIGKQDGVGMLFGWSLPRFAVVFLKSKNYMGSELAKYFDQF